MPTKKNVTINNEEAIRQKANLTNAFRRRSTQLQIQAFSVLGLIVVLLGAAIWIFFAAAQITKQDVATDKSFRRSADIESHINELIKKIPPEPKFVPTDKDAKEHELMIKALADKRQEFSELLDDINKQVLSNLTSGFGIDRGRFELTKVLKIRRLRFHPELGESIDEVGTLYETDNLVLFNNIISNNLGVINKLNAKFLEIEGAVNIAEEFRSKVRDEYSKRLNEWNNTTKKDRDELDEFLSGLRLVNEQERKQKFGLAAAPQEDTNVSIPFLIQTNVTRFGPMLIILFFVNILVNLYRYCVRLSAYYDARADSLELIDIGIDPDSFQKYAISVSPDALDIAKPPKLPTEYAVDIAKAAVSKIGSGTKG